MNTIVHSVQCIPVHPPGIELGSDQGKSGTEQESDAVHAVYC